MGKRPAPGAPAEFLDLVDWASKFHDKHGREPDADDDVHTCAAQRKTSRHAISTKRNRRDGFVRRSNWLRQYTRPTTT